MSENVTKADLVARIAEETGLKKVDAEKALAAVTNAIQSAIQDGKKVTLVGFGSFSVKDRRERVGTDPQTLEPIVIPSSRSVKFKPGKDLKKAANSED